MNVRQFGRVTSVTERPAGGILTEDVAATETTLVLDDVGQFGEEAGGALLRDDDGNEEIGQVLVVDPELDTLELEAGLAGSWVVGTTVLCYPEIVTRYAEVAVSGAGDDTVEALVPSQVARYLSLGTRNDEDQERVTLEYETETGNWLIHDVYVDSPEDNPIEVFYGDIVDAPAIPEFLDDLADVDAPAPEDGDVLTWVEDSPTGAWVPLPPSGGIHSHALDDLDDVDTTGVADGDVLVFDSGSGLWIPGEMATGTALLVQEGDSTVVAVAEVLDFDASDFAITESPTGEANIALAYGTAAGTPAEGNHTHAGADIWTVLTKSANEDVASSTTEQDDDELFFAIGTNEIWLFEAFLFISAPVSGSAPDFKYRFTGPTAATGSYHHHSLSTTDGSTHGGALVGPTPASVTAGTSTTKRLVRVIDGFIQTIGTAGNLRLQWCQNSSNVDATRVHAGSVLRYRKL